MYRSTYTQGPIHVSEIRPLSTDVEEGDLWWNPETKRLRIFDLGKWISITEKGIQGWEGEKGDSGKDGKDGAPGPRGPRGLPGKDGKDALNIEPLIQQEVKIKLKEHEEKFNHDPFLIGTKKISEAGMEDGMFLQFDAKGNRLIYAKMKEIVAKVSRLAGRGLSLPSQTGNSGKFLTTDGQRSSWATPTDTGITRSILSVAVDTTAAAASAKDYIYLCSGTINFTMPTAVGNTNRYAVKNVGVGTVTILFTGGQTGDGNASLTLAPKISFDLISDNANWQLI